MCGVGNRMNVGGSNWNSMTPTDWDEVARQVRSGHPVGLLDRLTPDTMDLLPRLMESTLSDARLSRYTQHDLNGLERFATLGLDLLLRNIDNPTCLLSVIHLFDERIYGEEIRIYRSQTGDHNYLGAPKLRQVVHSFASANGFSRFVQLVGGTTQWYPGVEYLKRLCQGIEILTSDEQQIVKPSDAAALLWLSLRSLSSQTEETLKGENLDSMSRLLHCTRYTLFTRNLPLNNLPVSYQQQVQEILKAAEEGKPFTQHATEYNTLLQEDALHDAEVDRKEAHLPAAICVSFLIERAWLEVWFSVVFSLIGSASLLHQLSGWEQLYDFLVCLRAVGPAPASILVRGTGFQRLDGIYDLASSDTHSSYYLDGRRLTYARREMDSQEEDEMKSAGGSYAMLAQRKAFGSWELTEYTSIVKNALADGQPGISPTVWYRQTESFLSIPELSDWLGVPRTATRSPSLSIISWLSDSRVARDRPLRWFDACWRRAQGAWRGAFRRGAHREVMIRARRVQRWLVECGRITPYDALAWSVMELAACAEAAAADELADQWNHIIRLSVVDGGTGVVGLFGTVLTWLEHSFQKGLHSPSAHSQTALHETMMKLHLVWKSGYWPRRIGASACEENCADWMRATTAVGEAATTIVPLSSNFILSITMALVLALSQGSVTECLFADGTVQSTTYAMTMRSLLWHVADVTEGALPSEARELLLWLSRQRSLKSCTEELQQCVTWLRDQSSYDQKDSENFSIRSEFKMLNLPSESVRHERRLFASLLLLKDGLSTEELKNCARGLQVTQALATELCAMLLTSSKSLGDDIEVTHWMRDRLAPRLQVLRAYWRVSIEGEDRFEEEGQILLRIWDAMSGSLACQHAFSRFVSGFEALALPAEHVFSSLAITTFLDKILEKLSQEELPSISIGLVDLLATIMSVAIMTPNRALETCEVLWKLISLTDCSVISSAAIALLCRIYSEIKESKEKSLHRLTDRFQTFLQEGTLTQSKMDSAICRQIESLTELIGRNESTIEAHGLYVAKLIPVDVTYRYATSVDSTEDYEGTITLQVSPSATLGMLRSALMMSLGVAEVFTTGWKWQLSNGSYTLPVVPNTAQTIAWDQALGCTPPTSVRMEFDEATPLRVVLPSIVKKGDLSSDALLNSQNGAIGQLNVCFEMSSQPPTHLSQDYVKGQVGRCDVVSYLSDNLPMVLLAIADLPFSSVATKNAAWQLVQSLPTTNSMRTRLLSLCQQTETSMVLSDVNHLREQWAQLFTVKHLFTSAYAVETLCSLLFPSFEMTNKEIASSSSDGEKTLIGVNRRSGFVDTHGLVVLTSFLLSRSVDNSVPADVSLTLSAARILAICLNDHGSTNLCSSRLVDLLNNAQVSIDNLFQWCLETLSLALSLRNVAALRCVFNMLDGLCSLTGADATMKMTFTPLYVRLLGDLLMVTAGDIVEVVTEFVWLRPTLHAHLLMRLILNDLMNAIAVVARIEEPKISQQVVDLLENVLPLSIPFAESAATIKNWLETTISSGKLDWKSVTKYWAQHAEPSLLQISAQLFSSATKTNSFEEGSSSLSSVVCWESLTVMFSHLLLHWPLERGETLARNEYNVLSGFLAILTSLTEIAGDVVAKVTDNGKKLSSTLFGTLLCATVPDGSMTDDTEESSNQLNSEDENPSEIEGESFQTELFSPKLGVKPTVAMGVYHFAAALCRVSPVCLATILDAFSSATNSAAASLSGTWDVSISASQRPAGVAYGGLRNAGCTCYLNALLQLLCHATPAFRQAVLSTPLLACHRSSLWHVPDSELVGSDVWLHWHSSSSSSTGMSGGVYGFGSDGGFSTDDSDAHWHRARVLALQTVNGQTAHVIRYYIPGRSDALDSNEYVFNIRHGNYPRESGRCRLLPPGYGEAADTVPPTSASAPAINLPGENTSTAPAGSDKNPIIISTKMTSRQAAAYAILEQLQRTFAHLTYGTSRAFDPRALIAACRGLALAYDVTQQNDAAEAADQLLDRLETATLGFHTGINTWRDIFSPAVFGGAWLAQKLPRHCPAFAKSADDCGQWRDARRETFLKVELPLRTSEGSNSATANSEATVVAALAEAVRGETMDGDNALTCDTCATKRPTVRRLAFTSLPSTLLIHLKRFALDFTTLDTLKLNGRMAFASTLDLQPYTAEALSLAAEDAVKIHGKDSVMSDAGAAAAAAAVTAAAMKSVATADYTFSNTSVSDQAGNSSPSNTTISRGSSLKDLVSNAENACANTEYELTGILVHAGVAAGGHYYSFVRPAGDHKMGGANSGWYRFDDDEVSPYDAASIPADCFGGRIHPDDLDNAYANALLLCYTRRVSCASSEVLSSEPPTEPISHAMISSGRVDPATAIDVLRKIVENEFAVGRRRFASVHGVSVHKRAHELVDGYEAFRSEVAEVNERQALLARLASSSAVKFAAKMAHCAADTAEKLLHEFGEHDTQTVAALHARDTAMEALESLTLDVLLHCRDRPSTEKTLAPLQYLHLTFPSLAFRFLRRFSEANAKPSANASTERLVAPIFHATDAQSRQAFFCLLLHAIRVTTSFASDESRAFAPIAKEALFGALNTICILISRAGVFHRSADELFLAIKDLVSARENASLVSLLRGSGLLTRLAFYVNSAALNISTRTSLEGFLSSAASVAGIAPSRIPRDFSTGGGGGLAFLALEAISALLGWVQPARVPLLLKNRTLTPAASHAFTQIFETLVAEKPSPHPGIDAPTLVSYFKRVSGVGDVPGSLAQARILIERFGSAGLVSYSSSLTLPSTSSTSATRLTLPGFLAYQATVASMQPRQAWRDLFAFNFGNDLQALTPPRPLCDGESSSDAATQMTINALSDMTPHCQAIIHSFTFYECALCLSKETTSTLISAVGRASTTVSDDLITSCLQRLFDLSGMTVTSTHTSASEPILLILSLLLRINDNRQNHRIQKALFTERIGLILNCLSPASSRRQIYINYMETLMGFSNEGDLITLFESLAESNEHVATVFYSLRLSPDHRLTVSQLRQVQASMAIVDGAPEAFINGRYAFDSIVHGAAHYVKQLSREESALFTPEVNVDEEMSSSEDLSSCDTEVGGDDSSLSDAESFYSSHASQIVRQRSRQARSQKSKPEPINFTIHLYKWLMDDDKYHWFLSIPPAGRSPGTTVDRDLYFTDANAIDVSPPRIANWKKSTLEESAQLRIQICALEMDDDDESLD